MVVSFLSLILLSLPYILMLPIPIPQTLFEKSKVVTYVHTTVCGVPRYRYSTVYENGSVQSSVVVLCGW